MLVASHDDNIFLMKYLKPNWEEKTAKLGNTKSLQNTEIKLSINGKQMKMAIKGCIRLFYSVTYLLNK